MNHWDRLEAALRGEPTDCAPVGFWRYWPEFDEDPLALAKAVMSWQRRFDFDLVRFMTPNVYALEAWGARTVYQPNALGTRTVAQFGVTRAEQWGELARLDVNAGRMAQPNAALRMAAQALGGTVPLLQTIHSPLSTAWDLAGDAVLEHMRSHPDALEAGLAIIAQACAELAHEAVRAGASGIALLARIGRSDAMTDDERARFGTAFDVRVIDAVRAEAKLSMLHVVGETVRFETTASYPVQMINWQDRTAGPDLRTAKSRFAGLLVGGIDATGPLLHGSEQALEAMVTDALAQTDGRRIMLAPGHTCALQTPLQHIDAVLAAVRNPARPVEEKSA